MDYNRHKKSDTKLDKNPYDRRNEKIRDKGFKSVEKGVKPVAKDTNKTRRANTRARLVGETVPTERPIANLKKALSKVSAAK